MYLCLLNKKKERFCFSEEPGIWKLRNVSAKTFCVALSSACARHQSGGMLRLRLAWGTKIQDGETHKIELCVVDFCMRRMGPC